MCAAETTNGLKFEVNSLVISVLYLFSNCVPVAHKTSIL